jgi:hypothetical protein
MTLNSLVAHLNVDLIVDTEAFVETMKAEVSYRDSVDAKRKSKKFARSTV